MDVGILLAAFLGMIVVAHVPIVMGGVLRKRGKLRRPERWKFWLEMSDYVFLTMACCALIGAAADVDRWWKQQELEQRLQSKEEHQDYIDATAAMAQVFHDSWWDACLSTRIASRDAWAEGKRLAEDRQVLPARRKLQEAADGYRHFVQTFGGEHLKEGANPEDRAVWMNYMEEDLGHVDELISLIDETAKSPVERTFFLLGPFIVAASLAIRFAKVTAKMVGLC